MGEDKNKDKEHHDGETAATSETNSLPDAHWDSHQDIRDLSRDRKARDAALAQTSCAKAHVHYQAILNERGAATLQTSLKVSSGANGFKVQDFLLPSLDQWRGNGTHLVMEKQQDPHQPVCM